MQHLTTDRTLSVSFLSRVAMLLFKTTTLDVVLIIVSSLFGIVALVLACVGIATPKWQTARAIIDQQTYTINTANFFYACRFHANGSDMNCGYRYYPIDARSNETDWNAHLDRAAGLGIVGIVCIAFGSMGTLMMMCLRQRLVWISFVGPIILFLACLFMLAGMAEGAYVLYYNDSSANLYQTAHLLTIFSFLVSCVVAGRLYPVEEARNDDLHVIGDQ